MGRGKALLFGAAALGGTFALALVLVELGLRLLAPIPYSKEVAYRAERHLGVELEPDRAYTLAGGGTCSVNNLGYRGTRKVSYEKPAGTFRIILTGGSSVFSYQTPDGGVFSEVLERRLRERFGERVEVVNAGTPGYTTFVSGISYRYRLRRMSPDVLIAYETWNDLKFWKAVERGLVLREPVHRDDPVRSFLRTLQLSWRIRTFWNRYVRPAYMENVYRDAMKADAAVAPDGPAVRWQRSNLRDLADSVKEDGALPVLATQALLLSRENISDPAVRNVVQAELTGMSFEEVLAAQDLAAGAARAVAEEKGAVLADAYAKVPRERRYFLDHVHLTPEGDAKAGEVLAEALLASPAFVSLAEARLGEAAPAGGAAAP